MEPAALHDLHLRSGAVFEEEGGGISRPAWYGARESDAVSAEYSAARESAALVELSDRGLLEVTGPLRQKFLQGLLSNDVQGRSPGQGCLAALMDAKGHLLAFLRALVTPNTVILEAPADRVGLVQERLNYYRVAAPVRFQAVAAAVLGLVGPLARAVLARAGAEVPELGGESHMSATLAGHEVRVVRATDLPGMGWALYVPSEAAAVWDALVTAGARPLGSRALDALRIEAGRPWYGLDVTEDNLLHETGLVTELHSSTKGCYVGQEVMARLEARGGHVNKGLRGLRLSQPSRRGATVEVGGKDVGRVTTAAVSPRRGPIAMAYVHRSLFAPGTHVEVEGAGATVVALPLEG